MSKQQQQQDENLIVLPLSRLSFAKIFKPKGFGGSSENPKYSCNFILNEKTHGKVIAKIKAAIQALLKEAKIKVAPDKLCYKNGADQDYDGYGEGTTYITASNSNKPNIVRLVEGRNVPVSEDEAAEMGILYSGCYVDGVVRLWVQNNKWGKRVNASLEVIRFRKHGEPFGSTVDVDDALAGVEIGDDEDEEILDDPMFG